jgi:flagellar protein FlbD
VTTVPTLQRGTDAATEQEGTPMIVVSRLNNDSLAINADLIERVEAMPDTVITLIDGKKLLVREGVDEVIELILGYRAAVLRAAYGSLDRDPTRHAPPHPTSLRSTPLHLVVDTEQS